MPGIEFRTARVELGRALGIRRLGGLVGRAFGGVGAGVGLGDLGFGGVSARFGLPELRLRCVDAGVGVGDLGFGGVSTRFGLPQLRLRRVDAGVCLGDVGGGRAGAFICRLGGSVGLVGSATGARRAEPQVPTCP